METTTVCLSVCKTFEIFDIEIVERKLSDLREVRENCLMIRH
jgi:hypothetical protein